MPPKTKNTFSRPHSKKKQSTIVESEIDLLRYFVRTTLGKQQNNEQSSDEVTFGDIKVDFIRQELFKEGKKIPARAREFKLLKYFLINEGKVLSRDQLLRDVWGYDHNPTTRSVDNYVLRLRKKIERDPSAPQHILTMHSSGYKFVR
ncbi:MAG: response regulator transcription factor [bacterium]